MIVEAPADVHEALNSRAKALRGKLARRGMLFSSTAGVKIRYNSKYNLDNGILGSFSWTDPDVILLAPPSPVHDLNHYADTMVSTYIHELHHRWQFRQGKFLYMLRSIPFVREVFLEITARDIEYAADRLMGL